MTENLNSGFTQRVVIENAEMNWLPSPSATVFRKQLARADAESGHTTSLVKYQPGAVFKSHQHPKGEEILVLDGVFLLNTVII